MALSNEYEDEFQDFISRLSFAIAKKLSAKYPSDLIERFCAKLTSDSFKQTLWEIKLDWLIHVGAAAPREKQDVLISILLINIVGPINRLKLPQDADRGELTYTFLSTLAALLEKQAVMDRFIGLSANLMKAA